MMAEESCTSQKIYLTVKLHQQKTLVQNNPLLQKHSCFSFFARPEEGCCESIKQFHDTCVSLEQTWHVTNPTEQESPLHQVCPCVPSTGNKGSCNLELNLRDCTETKATSRCWWTHGA